MNEKKRKRQFTIVQVKRYKIQQSPYYNTISKHDGWKSITTTLREKKSYLHLHFWSV